MFLWERARCDMRKLPESCTVVMQTRRPRWVNLTSFPVCDHPEDILLLVIGGPGIHGAYLPSFGATRAITRPIRRRDGAPVKSVQELRR